jgi:hypothetical protein
MAKVICLSRLSRLYLQLLNSKVLITGIGIIKQKTITKSRAVLALKIAD